MYEKMKYILSLKEKITMVFLFFAVFIGSIFELMGVTIFMPFIQVLMTPDQIYTNKWLHYFYALFSFKSTTQYLTAIAGLIIVIYVVKNVYLMWEKNAIYKFSYRLQKRISVKLLKAYMSEPYTFHLNHNIAVLQRSLQEDTDMFAKGIIHFMELLIEIIVCVVLGIYLFVVSKSITVIVLAVLILTVLISTKVSKHVVLDLGKKAQLYKGKLYQWMNQALSGIKEIKVLNRENYFTTIYEDNFDKYTYGLRLTRLVATLPRYMVEAGCMTGLLLAVILKLNYGQKELMDFIPQLSVFAVAAFRMMPSVGKINEHYTDIVYSLPSLDLIYHDLKDVDGLREKETKKNAGWEFKNLVEIKNVSYHYPNVTEDVIQNVSFRIPCGKTVAFTGKTGAGKTTMVDIILGLLTPQIGHIYADGMDIFKNLRTWQSEIGYIPQVIYLSDDTIRHNIAFGIPEEEIEDEKVVEAAKKAQIADFIDDLVDGYDTYVGDRGVRLSGGQRQRIGIARALYNDPEIMVLDEATSALDSDTERAVMESVDSLHNEKTIIIIAHRLKTIRNADIFYQVGDGKVTEVSREEVFKDE